MVALRTTAVFDTLAGIATLGTRRAPPGELAWPDAVLVPLSARAGAAETRLLRAAAANALWEAAGERAAPAAASGAAADFPVSPAGFVSELAAWRLARIVSGEHPYLLAEWLALAAASARVLPPQYLPLVLERVPPASRRHAGAVLGPAAQWLAARHPGWLAAAPVVEPSDARWKEGATLERLAELELVRRLDRARSREWLRATWEQDPPDAREAFLRALLPTIAPDDEDFLEMALDDKRKAVRQAAAEALSRLPDSAYARRNLERLGGLLSMAEGGGLLGKLRKRKLAVELPAAPDKAAQRDGIEPKVPAARKIGERAFWLVQMLSLVPPGHWCERFGCRPQELLEAALATDYATELLEAFTAAAVRHRRGGWTTRMARFWIDTRKELPDLYAAVQQLAAATPAEERGAFAEALFADEKSAELALSGNLLASLDFPWSAALTNAAFDRLATIVIADKSTYSHARNRLDDWACRCDVVAGVTRAAEVAGRLGDAHSWRNVLERFTDIVAFRAAMHEELKT